MSSTQKRITLALSKHQLKELNDLIDKFGESRSVVIHRAITLLHSIAFDKDERK